MSATTKAAAKPAPKHIARVKESTDLKSMRYSSDAAANALDYYEKNLVRQDRAARAARVVAVRRPSLRVRGVLRGLFQSIH